jgi:type VI secretion system protein ImpH
MAAQGRRNDTPLIERLLTEPGRFEFFQAVRLLERMEPSRGRVGEDTLPGREVVHFRAAPTIRFPASEVLSIRSGPDREKETGATRPGSPYEMIVNFMGLTGPKGVLPSHFTRLLLRRLRAKDLTLRDFFDLLNHRRVSLFYRAWAKYRFPIAYERARRQEITHDDTFTRCLFSLVGLGTAGQRGRHTLDDHTFIYYGGLFAHHPRSAVSLEQMLGHQFGVPVRIEQFQGQWLNLHARDRSMLPDSREPGGRHNRHGRDVVLGKRAWNVASKFRIRIGPLGLEDFYKFLPPPIGECLIDLTELTRTYVGTEFDFDVQLMLAGGEWPRCVLGGEGRQMAYLGWNVWLSSKSFDAENGDAVFSDRTAARP